MAERTSRASATCRVIPVVKPGNTAKRRSGSAGRNVVTDSAAPLTAAKVDSSAKKVSSSTSGVVAGVEEVLSGDLAVGGDRPAEGPGALPVREGESPWTRSELDAIRGALEVDLRRLATGANTLQMNIDQVIRDSSGVGDDQADSGAKAFGREQEMTLLAGVRESSFQAEQALRRIAEGSYGVCEFCGNAIGKLRLQAFPRATLCVSCKQRERR